MTLKEGFHDLEPGQMAVVVTRLEMTAPAALRGVAMPEGLSFEPLARDPDIYKDVFRRVGEDYLWYGRLKLDDLALCAIIESEAVELWTLVKDGRPEALLELDFRVSDECELAFFGLTPALIGSGAGGYLMDRAIEMAWARDIKRLHLQTCSADSPQALGFYRRSGFAPYKRQIEIYSDPRKAGLYPEDVAPQIPLL